MLQGQVGVADIILQGLEHLGEEAHVPLAQKHTSLSAALTPQLPQKPHFSVSHTWPLPPLLQPSYFHTPSILPGPAADGLLGPLGDGK